MPHHHYQIRTVIGFGSPQQGSEKVHGAPLGAKDLAAVKTHFGFDPTQVDTMGQVLCIHTVMHYIEDF